MKHLGGDIQGLIKLEKGLQARVSISPQNYLLFIVIIIITRIIQELKKDDIEPILAITL